MRKCLTGTNRYGIMYIMKNKYQISTFSELCVLYVRDTKEVLKEGSWFYCNAIRDSIPDGKFTVNIVTSKFFKNVLTQG